MENEKEFMNAIKDALSHLRIKVELFDFAGNILYPKERVGEVFSDFAHLDWSKDHQIWKDKIYYPVAVRNIAAISLPASQPEVNEMATLLSLLLEQLGQIGTAIHPMNKEESIRRIFVENLHGVEIEALSNRLHLSIDEPRCVLYFYANGLIAPTTQALSELFPPSSTDIIVELSPNTLVLLKSMTNTTVSELTELATAVVETVLEESGTQLYVGIGEVKPRLTLINASYREAVSALSIGQLMRGGRNVYAYANLLLERFMSDIPPEIAEKYYEEVFSAVNGKLFNEEMVRTIDAFFSCGLNLSEAARNLYIHRNTLVYRLEKVLRETGLDLRSFDDAVTYKLMRMLGNVTLKNKKEK